MLREIIQKPRNVDSKMFGIFALFEELLADEIRSLPMLFDQETVEQLLVFFANTAQKLTTINFFT